MTKTTLSIPAQMILENIECLPSHHLEEATAEQLQQAIYALQDGEALKYMGLGDEDIPAIEEAYTAIEEALDKARA